VGEHVHYVRAGWDMAERIKPLASVRWEKGLDKPLDLWRKELNVELIRHGPSSWYEVLSDLERLPAAPAYPQKGAALRTYSARG